MFENIKKDNFLVPEDSGPVKYETSSKYFYENNLSNVTYRDFSFQLSNKYSYFKSLIHWSNSIICWFVIIRYTISIVKNDRDSLDYGNFNGYFKVHDKLTLDILSCYVFYLSFILKVFYSQYKFSDEVYEWTNIFKVNDDENNKELGLFKKISVELWDSAKFLNKVIKLVFYLQLFLIYSALIYVFYGLPEDFKSSYKGLMILCLKFVLIANILKTFESFYFLFWIICKFLCLRSSLIISKLSFFVLIYEKKNNQNKFENSLNTFYEENYSKKKLNLKDIFLLINEHNDLCVLIKKYNNFWQFFLFLIFLTMPILIEYFIFLLAVDLDNYSYRISLAFLIVLFLSYFYLVINPAVKLASKISEISYYLKTLSKHNLSNKAKYKLENYLSKFEKKISFNCYDIFDISSEVYLDTLFLSGSLLFLAFQLYWTNLIYLDALNS